MNPPESVTYHHGPPIVSVSPPPDCTLWLNLSQFTSRRSLSWSLISRWHWCIVHSCSVGHWPSKPVNFRLFLFLSSCQRLIPFHLVMMWFQSRVSCLNTNTSSGQYPAAKLVGSGHLSLLSSDVLIVLEWQVQRRGDFLCGRKGKEERFFSQTTWVCLQPKLNYSGKMLDSIADGHDSVITPPFWSN